MKYLIIFIVVDILAAGAYLRFEKPLIWNRALEALAVPENSPGVSANPNNAPAAGADATSPTDMPPHVPQASLPPSTTAEVISPTSTTFINPDHVKQVEQPVQPSTQTQPASTNAMTNPPTGTK
jgi:hypothetical protein